MRVLVNDPLAPEAIEILRNSGLEVDETKIPKEELPNKISVYDGIIVRSATKVTREVIEAGERLKVIGRAGTGLDNIDLDAARARKITVLNTPTANSISVAELVFGFMISLSRHIIQGTNGLKNGKWEKKTLKGFELYDKTLGIVGFGHIGKEVARRAIAFGMKIVTYDVVKDSGGLDVKFVSLEELLKMSDYITVHLPLIPATKHMISDEEFSQMKSTAFFIHAARGGIVDDEALYRALRNGKIAGAALDVFESEPPNDTEQKILSMSNVIATPHLGASTVEAQKRVGMQMAKKIVDFLKEFPSA